MRAWWSAPRLPMPRPLTLCGSAPLARARAPPVGRPVDRSAGESVGAGRWGRIPTKLGAPPTTCSRSLTLQHLRRNRVRPFGRSWRSAIEGGITIWRLGGRWAISPPLGLSLHRPAGRTLSRISNRISPQTFCFAILRSLHRESCMAERFTPAVDILVGRFCGNLRPNLSLVRHAAVFTVVGTSSARCLLDAMCGVRLFAFLQRFAAGQQGVGRCCERAATFEAGGCGRRVRG